MYIPGQVWGYKTRPGEENSKIIILKVDADPTLGKIIHVAIDGLKIKNPSAPTKITDKIMHAPFSEEAISKSVTEKLSDDAALPEYKEGYGTWLEAFQKNQGGIFTTTVSQVVGYMEKGLNQ